MSEIREADAAELVCAFCLYIGEGEAAKAITIMGGNAVCEDHLGYAQNEAVSFAIQHEKEQRS